MMPIKKLFRFLQNLNGDRKMTAREKTYHEKYDDFYQNPAWRRLRARKFASACGLCERCKAKGVIRPGKEVHHIIPIEKNWELRYSFENLILLCAECHNAEHDRVSSLQRFNKLWEELNGGTQTDDRSEQKIEPK